MLVLDLNIVLLDVTLKLTTQVIVETKHKLLKIWKKIKKKILNLTLNPNLVEF